MESEMTNAEYIALLSLIFGGFAWLSGKLERIYRALANSVTHEQCAAKRDKCPCKDDIDELKENLKEKGK